MTHDISASPEKQSQATLTSDSDDHTNLLPLAPEGSIWASLVGNLRETIFPQKLPPLELTSTPVAVADPLAIKRDAKSSVVSFLIHALAIGLVFWLLLAAKKQPQVKKTAVTPVDISVYLPRTALSGGGGGGGGARQRTPPTKGKLPTIARQQVTPPQTLLVDHPRLAVQPTVVMPPMKIPDANLPNLGMPQATRVTVAQGSGAGSGFGQGNGGGLGIGSGGGIGTGDVGNTGGGVPYPGGDISKPKIVYAVDPEFSDEARRQKHQGEVSISVVVDAQGNPQNLRILRPLGMGLDEKAVEAVRQYRFKPALKNGKPIAVQIIVVVNFQLL